MTTVGDECPRGGNHEEGQEYTSGNLHKVDCSKCGTNMSTGMVSQPGDLDSDE